MVTRVTDDSSDETLRRDLEQHLGPCQPSDLRAHAERGVLLVLATELDVLEVAVALARDDTTRVSRWLEDRALVRGGPTDVDSWEGQGARLTSAIVRPWVLVRPDPEN